MGFLLLNEEINTISYLSDLNLLDWSTSNILAVALGSAVYLWNAATCTIQQLLNLHTENDYVSGLSWTPEGGILAVGTNSGTVQVKQ
jgi:WD40 repeat protein